MASLESVTRPKRVPRASWPASGGAAKRSAITINPINLVGLIASLPPSANGPNFIPPATRCQGPSEERLPGSLPKAYLAGEWIGSCLSRQTGRLMRGHLPLPVVVGIHLQGPHTKCILPRHLD